MPHMYTLPLSSSLGEVGYDVSASPSDLSRYITSTENFWPTPAMDMLSASHLSSQPSTSTPQTTTSSLEEPRVLVRADRTFIHLSPPDLSRTDPSPASLHSLSERGSSSKKRPREVEIDPFDAEDRGDRRQRNTEAARRYRQRKMDRLAELEEALAAVSKERDDFKMKLARAEAEVDVLRGLMGSKT